MSLEPTGCTALDTMLPALERVRKAGARRWIAECPSHQDGTPSLDLTIGAECQVLLLCRAGCATERVLAAIGRKPVDLFEPRPSGRRIVATYDYRDEQGHLLYQVCRYSPKDFRVRRPVGDGWAWNMTGVQRVLYRLPDLAALPAGGTVVIVEGEKDADRLAALGLVATTNLGGAGKWRAEYSQFLTGRDVVILPDNDEIGRRHALDVAAALRDVAASASIIDLPGLGPKGDVSDWLEAGGTAEALLDLVAGAERDGRDESGSEAEPAQPADPAATLEETLDALVVHILRFVHFARPAHADAVALWVAHTHAPLDRLEQSPVLAVTSAVKQSGKSRLLDVIEFVVRDPWRVIRPSEAVLFRKIDQDHPTILLDEVDTIFADRASGTEGIRAVFNSGNRRGTKVPRVVAQGKTFVLVEFDVFCPKATAGIGGLPDTILDRAIVIPMQRRARGERVERLRERQARQLATPIRDALARLVPDVAALALDDASLPSELDDRAQDGWEPLLAIADAAGGDWPSRARAAAVAIAAYRRPADDNHQLRMLADCRVVFATQDAPFLATADLKEALVGLEESPWSDIRGKAVTAHYIGKLLGAFDIESRRHRPLGSGNPVRGYFRSDLADAWSRYLGPESGTSGTTGTDDAPPARTATGGVPLVPDAPRVAAQQQRDLFAVAHAIFGDDVDEVIGHA